MHSTSSHLSSVCFRQLMFTATPHFQRFYAARHILRALDVLRQLTLLVTDNTLHPTCTAIGIYRPGDIDLFMHNCCTCSYRATTLGTSHSNGSSPPSWSSGSGYRACSFDVSVSQDQFLKENSTANNSHAFPKENIRACRKVLQ